MVVEEGSMKLLIVSDTFQYNTNGTQEVFEPTLREIESVANKFDEVLWLGYLQSKANPGHARAPLLSAIRLQTLPVIEGGKSWWNKFRILPGLPVLIWIIARHIRAYDVIHSRGPSVPAFICICLSFLFRKKIYWHKYAGNWIEPSPPLMYGIQKHFLIIAKHTLVTVNGRWNDQPQHVISLENPCFTEVEWNLAKEDGLKKNFTGKLILCFSGLVAESKGILALLEALATIPELGKYVDRLIIAGNGPAFVQAKNLTKTIPIPVEFRGYLTRMALNEVYQQSHVLLLPSRSEGFPKVVAEGAAFGCIPVVTDISSLSQYVINRQNGFLIENNNPNAIAHTLKNLFAYADLKKVSMLAIELSTRFTYERFGLSIDHYILKRS